jgi:glycosyltransferase involved in cell wall biosynthesis
MTRFKVSVIIPAFNEALNIGDIVSKTKALYPDFEVIVIDDGSTDNTAETAEKEGAIVFQHPHNIGNGAAIKSGIRVANGEVLVFMDSDGQHDPLDIGRMLDLFPEYDMVVGSRSLRCQTSFLRACGNTIYNWFASYAANFDIKDLTSGFRAIKADIARNFIYLLPNTYSYPTTLTLGVLRTGRSVSYLPIEMKKRKKGRSKIKLFQDGVRFFMIIIRIATLFSPMRVFLPVSLAMFTLGLLRYVYTLLTEGRFTNMSALLFVSAVIIFMMSLISEQITQLRFERRSFPQPTRRKDQGGSQTADEDIGLGTKDN